MAFLPVPNGLPIVFHPDGGLLLPSLPQAFIAKDMNSEESCSPNRLKHSCLVRAFRALGIKVSYVCDGPHWVLADGVEMLRPYGYAIKPVARICTASLGRFVVCRGGHAIALRRSAGDEFWSIDGKVRKCVFDKHWDALVNGAKIFEVFSSCRQPRGVRYVNALRACT